MMRMMRNVLLAIGALLIMLMMVDDADAERRKRWCWPFDVSCLQRSHRPAPRVRAKPDPAANLPPDCEQINKAVRAISPARLTRALLRSTVKQKAIIAECAAQEGQR